MATENLYDQQALDKLKEMAEGIRICMMSTSLDERPIPTRPMTIQEVDSNGILWFISNKNSDKNYDLRKDSETQLIFSNNGGNEYLSVYGTAEIYTDQASIDDKWSKLANAWFDGKHDPEVSIIGVRPTSVYYWDTKHGKFVDMALMIYKAVSGDEGPSGGVQGSMEV